MPWGKVSGGSREWPFDADATTESRKLWLVDEDGRVAYYPGDDDSRYDDWQGAVEAALSDLKERPGSENSSGTIHLPHGTTIPLSSPVSTTDLWGSMVRGFGLVGDFGGEIQPGGDTHTYFDSTYSGPEYVVDLDGLGSASRVEQLTFRGADGDSNGVRLDSADAGELGNVAAFGFGGYGIHLDDIDDSFHSGFMTEGCGEGSNGGSYGITGKGEYVAGIESEANARGIEWSGGTIAGFEAEESTVGEGVFLRSNAGYLKDGQVDRNATWGILTRPQANRLVVQDCTVRLNGQSGTGGGVLLKSRGIFRAVRFDEPNGPAIATTDTAGPVFVDGNCTFANEDRFSISPDTVDAHQEGVGPEHLNCDFAVTPESSPYRMAFDGHMSETPRVTCSLPIVSGLSFNDPDGDGYYESVDVSLTETGEEVWFKTTPAPFV
jgi:hypothetical protein